MQRQFDWSNTGPWPNRKKKNVCQQRMIFFYQIYPILRFYTKGKLFSIIFEQNMKKWKKSTHTVKSTFSSNPEFLYLHPQARSYHFFDLIFFSKYGPQGVKIRFFQFNINTLKYTTHQFFQRFELNWWVWDIMHPEDHRPGHASPGPWWTPPPTQIRTPHPTHSSDCNKSTDKLTKTEPVYWKSIIQV